MCEAALSLYPCLELSWFYKAPLWNLGWTRWIHNKNHHWHISFWLRLGYVETRCDLIYPELLAVIKWHKDTVLYREFGLEVCDSDAVQPQSRTPATYLKSTICAAIATQGTVNVPCCPYKFLSTIPAFVAVKIAHESILVPSHAAKVSSPAPKQKEILKAPCHPKLCLWLLYSTTYRPKISICAAGEYKTNEVLAT